MATKKTAPRAQKTEAQAKADALRQKQLAAARRTNLLFTLGGVVAAGLVVWVIAFIVGAANKAEAEYAPPVNDVLTVPSSFDDGFAIGQSGIVGDNIDPSLIRVDIYEDFMCPACYQFEQTNAADLVRLREEGSITVVYHPIAILNRFSDGTDYSSRTVAAAAVVAEYAPAQFENFVSALYSNQPPENTRGLKNSEIEDLAMLVGVPEDVVAKFAEGEFILWADVTTEEASIAGITGTPTILINGFQNTTWGTPGALAAELSLGIGITDEITQENADASASE